MPKCSPPTPGVLGFGKPVFTAQNLQEEKKVKPVVDKEKLLQVVFTAGSIAVSGSLNRWLYYGRYIISNI